jgi:RNA polymerase sigma-70 factor (ECF subfamily)
MSDVIRDEEILARIRAGDKSGCALCIERYGPSLYRLALRLAGNEKDAEDIVQESFLNAFKAIDSFDGRSQLGTWLYRITYNNAMMRLRKEPGDGAVSVEETLDSAEEGYAVPRQFFDWCCLPEQDFATEEVRRELDKALGDLSPALSSTFVLRELEGLSTRETAETLGVSEEVVKTRLRRARLQLREALSIYFAERFQPAEEER